MANDFPSMAEVEHRRQRAQLSILELCREAKIAAWSYHRLRKREMNPRMDTLKRLYGALDRRGA